MHEKDERRIQELVQTGLRELRVLKVCVLSELGSENKMGIWGGEGKCN